MKAYWANNADPEWQFLVFAENVREAKKVAFESMPCECEWIWVRVWLADQKWMKLYDRVFPYVDTYEGDYETWDEYWEAEYEV